MGALLSSGEHQLVRGHRALARARRLGHMALALEEDAFFHDDDRRLDVTRDARPALELHALARGDVADYLAVNDEAAGENGRLNAAGLADDERIPRVNFPAQLPVEHHGPRAGVTAFDLGPFVEEGADPAL